MYYKYNVSWYSELEEDVVKTSGLVSAKTYSKALINVLKDYGEDLIEFISLEPISESDAPTLDIDEINCAFKDNLSANPDSCSEKENN